MYLNLLTMNNTPVLPAHRLIYAGKNRSNAIQGEDQPVVFQLVGHDRIGDIAVTAGDQRDLVGILDRVFHAETGIPQAHHQRPVLHQLHHHSRVRLLPFAQERVPVKTTGQRRGQHQKTEQQARSGDS